MILLTEDRTRVNDKVFLKNGNTSPIINDVINENIPFGPNTQETKLQANFYQNFGLDIVAETVFDYPYPYITEKTLRPISSKRPFIVLGSKGILELLQRKGFLTFDKIIDESYDQIDNPSDRFDSVTDSIKTFVSQPIEKIKKDVLSIEKILNHNFQQLMSLEDIEISQLIL